MNRELKAMIIVALLALVVVGVLLVGRRGPAAAPATGLSNVQAIGTAVAFGFEDVAVQFNGGQIRIRAEVINRRDSRPTVSAIYTVACMIHAGYPSNSIYFEAMLDDDTVGVLAQVSPQTLAGWDCDRVPAQPGSAFDRLTIHATMR